ncbi:MAG: hypothetical protein IJT88_01090 [Kiritimatiellae bacterium]|nr:hypothetical protein [Kiritimatiellia bacterium]
MAAFVCLAGLALVVLGGGALMAWMDEREEAWRRGECGGGGECGECGARGRRCKTVTGETPNSDFPGAQRARDGEK